MCSIMEVGLAGVGGDYLKYSMVRKRVMALRINSLICKAANPVFIFYYESP